MPITIQPIAPSVGPTSGEAGINWLGTSAPSATSNTPVTTGFGVSVSSKGGRMTYGLPFPLGAVTQAQFGFVASSQPSNNAPSTWYPGDLAVISGTQVAGISIGSVFGAGAFAPALGTVWWVWLKAGDGLPNLWGTFVWGVNAWGGTTSLQIGQLTITP